MVTTRPKIDHNTKYRRRRKGRRSLTASANRDSGLCPIDQSELASAQGQWQTGLHVSCRCQPAVTRVSQKELSGRSGRASVRSARAIRRSRLCFCARNGERRSEPSFSTQVNATDKNFHDRLGVVRSPDFYLKSEKRGSTRVLDHMLWNSCCVISSGQVCGEFRSLQGHQNKVRLSLKGGIGGGNIHMIIFAEIKKRTPLTFFF